MPWFPEYRNTNTLEISGFSDLFPAPLQTSSPRKSTSRCGLSQSGGIEKDGLGVY